MGGILSLALVTVAVYWAVVESGLALTAACLPIFYSVTKELFKRATATDRSGPTSKLTSRRRSSSMRPRKWPFSNLGLADLVSTTRTGKREETQGIGENWSMNDQIPMIAKPSHTAQVTAHAGVSSPRPKEGDEFDYTAPAWGEIRVNKRIEQTEDIV